MAVSADISLPRSTGRVVSPMSGKPPSYGAPAPRINDGAVRDMTNNQYAASGGTGQATLQGMDRAGVSRGRGQQFRADMAQEMADVSARSSAAQTERGAAMADAQSRNAYASAMRGEQLTNMGLLEGLRGNRLNEYGAQRNWQQNIYEAIRNGQFQLDGMTLDYSPFVNAFFRGA
jgi:hypothetical protein